MTGVCVAPFGAHPTSQLPYYCTDYRELADLASADDPRPWQRLKGPQDERQRHLRTVASLDLETLRLLPSVEPSVKPDGDPYTTAELMACVLAREIPDYSVCSVGSVSPLATVAYLLAKRLYAANLVLITSNGGYIDVAPRPMSITYSEVADYRSAVAHLGGDDTYHWYYQKGIVTHEVVSAAQIDQYGRTNNVQIRRAEHGLLRLPGQGGMADVADMHRNFSLYLARQSKQNLVADVDFTSAARSFHTEEIRRRYGYQPGVVSVLTNLGRFEYSEPQGRLVLTHLHPGVSVDQMQENVGFPLSIEADIARTEPPRPEELSLIRGEIDPLGVRRLEFAPSKDRMGLIYELLRGEEAALDRLLKAP